MKIIKDDNFPQSPVLAIKNAFTEAERLFLSFSSNQASEIGDYDKSGSCAVVCLIVDDTCYIANTGDSRASLSMNGGKDVLILSNDHKPTDDYEV